MKLHWGHKIVGGMILFMLFILSMSYYMFLQHTDTLVDENYYENGLVYDKELVKHTNALDTNALPEILLVGEELQLKFKKPSTYQVALKRPSDAALDQFFNNQAERTSVELPVGAIKKGLWKVEINWRADGKDYLISEYLTKK